MPSLGFRSNSLIPKYFFKIFLATAKARPIEKEEQAQMSDNLLSRGVYSSLFQYNHADKKLQLLADFIKN